MSYKVEKNHTLKEYNEKYKDSNLAIYSKEEVSKDESLLKDKKWWLIEDNYYEVKDSSFFLIAWWKNLKSVGRIIFGVCTLVLIILIVVGCICLKSCNDKKNDDSSSQNADVGTVYLTYYTDAAIDYSNKISSIKTNEKQWTVQFTIKDDVYDWYIAFFIIDGGNWKEIAKSPEHATSQKISYQEVVTLNADVDLSLYKDQTITVALYCNMC